MASFNYLKLLRTANKLIDRFGGSVDVHRTGGVVVEGGSEKVIPSSTFAVVGVQVDYKASEIDGSRVISGDVKFLCKASPAVKVGDMFALPEGDKRVVNTNPLNPAGTVLLYQLQLRG